MTSEDIVKALGDMADRPWPTWKRGKPITQRQVARMLKGFDIKPQNIKIDGKVPKGYYKYDLVAARDRYASLQGPLQPLPENNSNEFKELEAVLVADIIRYRKRCRSATDRRRWL